MDRTKAYCTFSRTVNDALNVELEVGSAMGDFWVGNENLSHCIREGYCNRLSISKPTSIVVQCVSSSIGFFLRSQSDVG
jgi:hypothetical protein